MKSKQKGNHKGKITNKLKNIWEKSKRSIGEHKYISIVLAIVLIIWQVQRNWYLLIKWNGWKWDGWGPLTDWMSPILTGIITISIVIFQVRKQEGITRALNIENSRPRFSLSFVGKCSNLGLLLYSSDSEPKMSSINKIIEGNILKFKFPVIKNISKEIIYEISFSFNYCNQKKKKTFKRFSNIQMEWKTRISE